jgi:aspartyl-tRNA(Asn)/glutamyl-tRNA(Gln) amidotransferase subunit C
MSLSLEEVKKIAKLSRIKLAEGEVEKYQGEINKIFNWIEQLQEVNTDNVEPMFSSERTSLPLREDEVTDGKKVESVLKNAPESKYGFFVVPKVIE